MVSSAYSLLLVDDEEANRLILGRRLEREGYQVTSAGDGLRALELLRGHHFDLVLLDKYMPTLDGLATLDAVKSDTALRDIPVVMLSAESLPEAVEQCLARGAADYLFKPVDPENLKQCVRRNLEAGPVEVPAEAAAAVPEPRATEEAIDWQALTAHFNGRMDFIRKLVGAVLSSHGETPAKLREAAARRDMEKLAFLAHALKGTGGNMKAWRLHGLGARTENSARGGSPDAIELAAELADAMEALIEGLKARV